MASGLDTESIVSQLMALEQNKVTAVQRRQIGVQQHKDDLGAIKTKLDAFKTAAARSATPRPGSRRRRRRRRTRPRSTSSLLGGAGIGGHSIQVDQARLVGPARLHLRPSTTAGSLTLHYGTNANAPGNSKVTIDVAANATAADIAAAVNANEGSPVYAAVVKDSAGAERVVFSVAQDRRRVGLHRRHLRAGRRPAR